MDNHGQFAIEYLLVLGVSTFIILSIIPQVLDSNELNICMANARSGALTGAEMDSFAMYPDDSFNNYLKTHPRLQYQSKVVIIKLNYKKMGFNTVHNKTKIQIRIIASAPTVRNDNDRNCIGDRINYCARRSICEAFKTENLTNSVYNPAFSNNYMVTTADVQWV
jgi:hypothetical protein